MKCVVEDLGLIEYQKAWELQDKYASEIAAGRRSPTLLLLEHPHVYTFGRLGGAENLLWNETELKDKDIAVHWVDRGGDVTYHGPGQLVGYPLIPLGPIPVEEHTGVRADHVGYLRRLEQVLIEALTRLGVEAGRRSGLTGVWVDAGREKPAKLAAIGVKVDARGVSRHGFALNVNPNMSYWEGIIACGLAGEQSVSLADLLEPFPTMERVKNEVVTAFGEVFGCKIYWG